MYGIILFHVDHQLVWLIHRLSKLRKRDTLFVIIQEDLSVLESLENHHPSSSPPLNTTVWFSHYPTATIAGDHATLRRLMSSSVAHVCGHLHDLLGLVPTMYTRHPSGHLELELVDFKDKRGYVTVYTMGELRGI